MKQNPNLTLPHSDDLQAKIAASHKGQAHWALTGPANRTCRECRFCNHSDYYASGSRAHGGRLKPAVCSKRTSPMNGQSGPKVPHDAKACRYFEEAKKIFPVK